MGISRWRAEVNTARAAAQRLRDVYGIALRARGVARAALTSLFSLDVHIEGQTSMRPTKKQVVTAAHGHAQPQRSHHQFPVAFHTPATAPEYRFGDIDFENGRERMRAQAFPIDSSRSGRFVIVDTTPIRRLRGRADAPHA
ncbi:hypothetical protein EVAR_59286_1 [Eumeta japonica]|uniref:Uncharacterized protein n=1 Tax=Eumeta variegata TaxID=151549 RepID=A0A4C1YAU2_EUMVA|nr:hypothetical protein EVAR_59286_1 [Eumeta japonica]